MAENDAGERTEEATPRRREEARKKGQVARSRELVTAGLVIGGAAGLMWFGDNIGRALINVSRLGFSFGKDRLENNDSMVQVLVEAIGIAGMALLPLLVMLFVIALASSVAIGGLAFSVEQLEMKWDRLSPAKGFKRMFGLQSLIELIKSFGKLLAVGGITVLVLWKFHEDFLLLGRHQIGGMVEHAASLLSQAFLYITLALLVIVFIDVPFQLWNFSREMRMSKQDVRDEYKETEGKPEVKGRIRRMQREIAQRRMMSQVPKADVVITNPQHYAVALKYDPLSPRAPMVIAKGADLVALQIRRVAEANNVHVLEAPPLARALYHTTELDREIPQGLYLAVAQVLAYVFSLKQYGKAGTKPLPGEFPIPDDMRY